jgi:hypothetical protein
MTIDIRIGQHRRGPRRRWQRPRRSPTISIPTPDPTSAAVCSWCCVRKPDPEPAYVLGQQCPYLVPVEVACDWSEDDA